MRMQYYRGVTSKDQGLESRVMLRACPWGNVDHTWITYRSWVFNFHPRLQRTSGPRLRSGEHIAHRYHAFLFSRFLRAQWHEEPVKINVIPW